MKFNSSFKVVSVRIFKDVLVYYTVDLFYFIIRFLLVDWESKLWYNFVMNFVLILISFD